MKCVHGFALFCIFSETSQLIARTRIDNRLFLIFYCCHIHLTLLHCPIFGQCNFCFKFFKAKIIHNNTKFTCKRKKHLQLSNFIWCRCCRQNSILLYVNVNVNQLMRYCVRLWMCACESVHIYIHAMKCWVQYTQRHVCVYYTNGMKSYRM